MNDKNSYRLLLSVIGILSVILIGLLVITFPDPYTEITTLEKQYLGNVTGNGGECINCLIIEVGEVYIDCPDVAYPLKKHAVYYFAGEHEIRDDLHPGDSIDIRWKYILFKGYRIREVSLRNKTPW